MPKIHPTAIVSPKAELADDVEIGAYAVIGDDVRIGAGTQVHHHTSIIGHTTIGEHNNIFSYAAIGFPPQDLTYKGEPTKVIIGDNNTIREFVTINTGALKGHSQTVLGNNNFIMAYCHIAHDSILEDNIVIANALQLAGHVKIEKYAVFGGMVGVHHFVTIGQHAFVAGLIRITQDIPPFMVVDGHPPRVRAVNVIGLERRDFSPETIKKLKDAHKLIWRSGRTPAQAFKILEKAKDQTPEITYLIKFLRQTKQGNRGRARESLRKPEFAIHPATNL